MNKINKNVCSRCGKEIKIDGVGCLLRIVRNRLGINNRKVYIDLCSECAKELEAFMKGKKIG